jgi:alpha-tubulin suppressor-like RCC1 family protein
LRNKAYLDDLKEWFLDDLQKRKKSHPLYLEAMNSKKIQTISCGEAHTMMLLIQGEIWVWGSNNYGQLGLGDSLLEVIKMYLLFFNQSLHHVCCIRKSSMNRFY